MDKQLDEEKKQTNLHFLYVYVPCVWRSEDSLSSQSPCFCDTCQLKSPTKALRKSATTCDHAPLSATTLHFLTLPDVSASAPPTLPS